uniref:Uncharacterized protein n=1 Tax=Aegilops tauschii subsp. strangulata TaxID=200361 RepID=A0A453EBX5_AEGTS
TSSTSPWPGDSPWRHLGVSDSEDMPGEEGQHHLGDVDGSRHLWRCSSCSRSLADGRRKPPALSSRRPVVVDGLHVPHHTFRIGS